MTDLLFAFITGLTTGGLSCLAVQGGLLASSLANQIEQDLQPEAAAKGVKLQIAQPILWFLAAKILAYTLVGFLLGALGAVFELSSTTRAVLQIGIGIFMLGSALRMLNVHPVFRFFVFEPPSFITRFIRRRAKNGGAFITPTLLGIMTVLIPCGITQIMMATAVATADPVKSAALMFSFTLGTSPVFFGVAYFATRLGSKMEKYLTRGIAVVILLIGLLTINTGLNLIGSPLSVDSLVGSILPVQAVSASSGANGRIPAASSPQTGALSGGCPMMNGQSGGCNHGAGQSGGCPMMGGQGSGQQSGSILPAPSGPAAPADQSAPQGQIPAQDSSVSLTINVNDYGYNPNLLHAPAGKPIRLELVSKDVHSCSLAFVIPSLGIQKLLDPTGKSVIELPAQPAGSTLRFSCSMGMYTGKIVFDL